MVIKVTRPRVWRKERHRVSFMYFTPGGGGGGSEGDWGGVGVVVGGVVGGLAGVAVVGD
jgi:hypothetical protein